MRSPAVIERELRREEAARRRAQRTAEKLVRELEWARRKRSEAARRGWKTRAAKAKHVTQHAEVAGFAPDHHSE